MKNARKAAGLTQKQLAEAVGAKHNSISNWENDQNRPGPDGIAALCEALHVSPNFLFEASDVPWGFLPLPEGRRVPIVGRIACGQPIMAEENFEGYAQLPAGRQADFCLICQGDSMVNAGIYDGDIVYIHSQPVVENGEIAAVRIGSEATLKRIYSYPDHLLLVAGNQSYPPIVCRPDAMEDIQIEGKVVGIQRWF